MMRLILASLALSSLTAMGQVKIRVSPPHPKKYETVHASVENTGSNPITFCIEVGQTSPKEGGETESTPWPFWVQRNNNGKWGTLMIGPDVGHFGSPNVLDGGKSVGFVFRLGASGQMRLRMNYWNGSVANLDCDAPPEGEQVVTSAVFVIE